MGRIYTAHFDEVAVTVQQDIFEVVAPADAVVLVHELGLSQNTDLADAGEELLLLLLKSGQTTSGSGGTTVTPTPKELGDAAFGGTVEANNTTKASAGTIVTHYAWNWNIRIPFQHVFTPETRPVLSPSRRGTFELGKTPTDSITMSGYVVLEEIGG